MIYARPATPFDATLQAAPTGLVGTLGVRIIDQPAGTTIAARVTSGISEQPPGSGIYSTSLVAPSLAGTYLVVWDTGGVTPVYASEELQVSGVLPADSVPPDFAPSVDEVAALLHARTTKRGGSEVGTFTAETRPTAAEVEAMISMAASLVASSTGRMPTLAECPDAPNVVTAVRALIAMRATLFIEPSLWPEQTTAGVSPYTAMREQYEAELPRVVDAVHDCRASGEVEPGGAGEGGPGDAVWWFPGGYGFDVVTW